jgi:mannobiose 2-epimerase
MSGLNEKAVEWRSELERELRTNILDFWIRHAKDEKNGGFVGKIKSDMTVVPEADKGLVLNARILWTFAAAYRKYGDPAYLEMAERAYDMLDARFRDREHGGLYWMVDFAGRPSQDKKQVYGQAFAIYALSEYVRANGPRSEAALEWAKELYRLLEKHAYDPVHLGYVEALARDWTETGDLSLSGKDLNERKSMNTHLHVLEAYTNLYRVWKPAGLRAKLAELIDVHLDRIVNPANHHFLLFFDDEWRSKSEHISYGHDIEGSWLLCEAAEVLGDPERIARVRREALAMAAATLAEGVDKDGGVLNEADGKGHLDDTKDWWPQAEAMVGFLNAYQLSGDKKYWEASLGSWAFTKQYIVDKEFGEWHWQVSRDGIPNRSQAKVDAWKCPYHNSRACFEGMERLEHLIGKGK